MKYLVAIELLHHIYLYCYFWKWIIFLQLIIHVYEAPIHSWGCHFSPSIMCYQGTNFGVQAFYHVPLFPELSFSPIWQFLIDILLSLLVQKNFSSVLLAFRYHTLWYLMPNKGTLDCTLFLCSSRWISSATDKSSNIIEREYSTKNQRCRSHFATPKQTGP